MSYAPNPLNQKKKSKRWCDIGEGIKREERGGTEEKGQHHKCLGPDAESSTSERDSVKREACKREKKRH